MSPAATLWFCNVGWVLLIACALAFSLGHIGLAVCCLILAAGNLIIMALGHWRWKRRLGR